MDAPDPEGISLLTKVIAAATPLAGVVWGFVKLWNKKADKHAVANQFQAVNNEIAIQRGHIAKIFDQMREAEHIAEARHRELLMHLVGGK